MSKAEGFLRRYSWFLIILISFLVIHRNGLTWAMLQIYPMQIGLFSIAIMGVMVFHMTGEMNLCIGAQVSSLYTLLLMLTGVFKLKIFLAIVISLSVSFLLAVLYSVLNDRLKIRAIYFTFAMEVILQGISAYLLSKIQYNQIIASYINFYYAKWIGIPSWYFLLAALFAGYYILLHRMTIGRCFSLVGKLDARINDRALPVGMIKLAAFAVSTISLNIYTIFLFLRMGRSYGTLKTNLTYDVLIALCIGGAGLTGGKRSIRNALIGAVGIVLLNSVINSQIGIKTVEWSLKGMIMLSTLYLLRENKRYRDYHT